MRRTLGDDRLATQLDLWRARVARTAWVPETVGSEGPALGSRFGGRPALAVGESWPACGSCAAPLHHLVQLALSDTPEATPLHGAGLLQVFCCRNDQADCATWDPGSPAVLVRTLQGDLHVTPPPSGHRPLRARAVVSWSAVDDLPDPEDHELVGLAHDHDFDERTVRLSCRDPAIDVVLDLDDEMLLLETIASARRGDKLSGWPRWIQGSSYPPCPVCQAATSLLLQIDSLDNLAHMFGDGGCAQVTFCPAHPDQLAFGWQCS